MPERRLAVKCLKEADRQGKLTGRDNCRAAE